MQLKTDEKYGFRYVPQTPDHDSLKKLYGDEFYDSEKPTYLSKVEQELDYWQAIFGLRLDLMSSALGQCGRILDIGAGGGFFLHSARQKGWQTSGVEPSKQAVAYASQRFEMDIFCGFLDAFSAPRESFDAIHTSLVLEHIPDPVTFLQQALALLKPGGVLWIEVPNDFNPLQEVITARLDKQPWWVVPKHHLNYFNFESLERLVTGQGCERLERLASFPMEIFPLMGMDYLGNDQVGAQAHAMRMQLERHLLHANPQLLIEIYRNLARAGIGRTCNLLARKIHY